jgi:hypothetical protein
LAIRFVPASEPFLPQLALQFSARDSRLHAGLTILTMDPLDLVHRSHVDGDDHARFSLGQGQTASNVRATAIGNEAHVVFRRELDHALSRKFRTTVKHHVDHARQVPIKRLEDFITGRLPVTAHGANPIVIGKVVRELLFNSFAKGRVLARWRNDERHFFAQMYGVDLDA